MKRAAFKFVLAILPLITAFFASAINCRGGETWDSCRSCCSTCYSACAKSCTPQFCSCDGLRKVCDFRLVDGCTHEAWHRTWNGPYAPNTPLRQYYIPRMPSCWGADGYRWRYQGGKEQYYTPNCMDCEKLNGESLAAAAPVVGFPPQSERLGQIHNELDVISGVATPARVAAPAK